MTNIASPHRQAVTLDHALQYQPTLFDADPSRTENGRSTGRSGSFVDNMSLPVHRWYRYSAGFSAEWVRSLVREGARHQDGYCVLDPFAGVGTTLLACEAEGVASHGFENHPFIHRITIAKLNATKAEPLVLKELFESFINRIPQGADMSGSVPNLLGRCYAMESLRDLLAIRDLYLSEFDNDAPESTVLWLAITSILRSCSNVGTAQWQYVLPKKTRTATTPSPISALFSKAVEIISDIQYAQKQGWSRSGRIFLTDARSPDAPCRLYDAVITSPPYPNNYDYADATRLEMTFWGQVNSWKDLQNTVRRHLIRSCSQHSAAEKIDLERMLAEDVLEPVRSRLALACRALAEIRKTKGGKKTYHTMAAAYFRDVGLVFKSLRDLCRPGASVCFVIGDSAPYGIYLDVDTWLGDLAIAAGFKRYRFEKLRDRNVRWKNRKHRIPLKEGRLWIEA